MYTVGAESQVSPEGNEGHEDTHEWTHSVLMAAARDSQAPSKCQNGFDESKVARDSNGHRCSECLGVRTGTGQ